MTNPKELSDSLALTAIQSILNRPNHEPSLSQLDEIVEILARNGRYISSDDDEEIDQDECGSIGF